MKTKKFFAALSAASLVFASVSFSAFAENGSAVGTKETFDNLTTENASGYFTMANSRGYNPETYKAVQFLPLERSAETEESNKAFQLLVPANTTGIDRLLLQSLNTKIDDAKKGEWTHIAFSYKGIGYCKEATSGGVQVMTRLYWNTGETAVLDGTNVKNASTVIQGVFNEDNVGSKITPFGGTAISYTPKERLQWHDWDCYFGGPTGRAYKIYMDGEKVSEGECTPYDTSISSVDNAYICGVEDIIIGGNAGAANMWKPYMTNPIMNASKPLTSDFSYALDDLLVEKTSAAPCLDISVSDSTATATLELNAGVEIADGSALILASYVDGKLAAVDIATKSTDSTDKITATLSSLEKGTVVKAMVFDSLGGMKPLMDFVEETVK